MYLEFERCGFYRFVYYYYILNKEVFNYKLSIRVLCNFDVWYNGVFLIK